jgi:hypothetical protein
MTNKSKPTDKLDSILSRMLFTMATLITTSVILSGLSHAINVEAQSTDNDASNIYQTKSMSLGDNIKNLVILIPNEAHESQNIADSTSDQRHINQPYVPWHTTVPKGAAIVWFNGDVDHDRKITLTREDDVADSNSSGSVSSSSDSGNLYFDSGVFAYNTATQPVVMNDTGSFYYFESDVNNEDLGFVMNGTINVVDQPGGSTPGTNQNTVGTLMVPTEDLATYTSDLENSGLSVLSTHNFNDIRGGDPQTLMVWATSSGTNSIENIVSQLQEITSTLPYS